MVGDSNTAPVWLMSPRGKIAQNLRLSCALLSPEKHSRVGTFESLVSDTTDVLGAPVMVAELLITLQVKFVVNHITAL